MLPRLFFPHFGSASLVLADEDGALRAFPIGFRSADRPEVAFVHFVGVDPTDRGRGVAARARRDRFRAARRARERGAEGSGLSVTLGDCLTPVPSLRQAERANREDRLAPRPL